MDKKAQPADAGAPFEHGDVANRFCVLNRAAKVERSRLQNNAFGGDFDHFCLMRPLHIQHVLLINHEFVVEPQVVAVGVEELGIVGFDKDFIVQHSTDFFA